jgi:hypothetical protein
MPIGHGKARESIDDAKFLAMKNAAGRPRSAGRAFLFVIYFVSKCSDARTAQIANARFFCGYAIVDL